MGLKELVEAIEVPLVDVSELAARDVLKDAGLGKSLAYGNLVDLL